MCGECGASVGCCRDGCGQVVHYPCAVQCGWLLDTQTFIAKCKKHATALKASPDQQRTAAAGNDQGSTACAIATANAAVLPGTGGKVSKTIGSLTDVDTTTVSCGSTDGVVEGRADCKGGLVEGRVGTKGGVVEGRAGSKAVVVEGRGGSKGGAALGGSGNIGESPSSGVDNRDGRKAGTRNNNNSNKQQQQHTPSL